MKILFRLLYLVGIPIFSCAVVILLFRIPLEAGLLDEQRVPFSMTANDLVYIPGPFPWQLLMWFVYTSSALSFALQLAMDITVKSKGAQ